MAETKAKPARKAPRARRAPSRTLQAVADQIDDLADRDFLRLVELLTDQRGLTLREGSGGVTKVTMLGITAQTTAGRRNALRAWAAKARRQVLAVPVQVAGEPI